MYRSTSAMAMFKSSAAFDSLMAPSARARRQSRLKRLGCSPKKAPYSSYGGERHPRRSNSLNRLRYVAWLIMRRSRQRCVSAWMLAPKTCFSASNSPRAMALRRLPTSNHSASAGMRNAPAKRCADPLGVEVAGDIEDHVPQLVPDREPLTLAPVLGVDDNEGHHVPPGVPSARGESADAAERKREYLYATFFEQLHEVGDWLVARPQWRRRASAARSTSTTSRRTG